MKSHDAPHQRNREQGNRQKRMSREAKERNERHSNRKSSRRPQPQDKQSPAPPPTRRAGRRDETMRGEPGKGEANDDDG